MHKTAVPRGRKRMGSFMLDLFSMTQLLKILHAPICIYRPDGGLFQALEDVEGKTLIEREVFEKEISKDFPYVRVAENGEAFCLLWVEQDKKWIGIGMLRIYTVYADEIPHYPHCDKDTFAAVIALLWKQISGEEIGIGRLWYRNVKARASVEEVISREMFQIQEEGNVHNPYSQELREMDSICHGDVEALKRSIDEVYSGQVGRLAKDEVRQQKNLAISVITLASRSAIKGGLNPELAFSMSDNFIRNIEENLYDPIRIEHAVREAEFEFTKMVHEINQKSASPLINQVRDYVFCHMHEPIRIRDIAAYIGITPNYLSEQFSRHMGMTLKQYIINEKIAGSERMLRYTEYSLQEISTMYAFSSQSRFSVYFQRKNGITPAKYRKMHREV